jgi:hypothetical protein
LQAHARRTGGPADPRTGAPAAATADGLP